MKALVTSASRKLPLLRAIRGQLDSVGGPDAVLVVAADADPTALAAYAWPDFWAMPRIDSAPERVLAEVVGQGFDVLVPTSDADVAFYADHRDVLAARGVQAMVAGPAAVRACSDKVAFAATLLDAGLPAIPTSLDPFDPLLGAAGRVVKERRGAGAIGTALDVDAETAAALAEALAEPCFQPFVPGPELSIDAYRTRDGRLLGLVARTRDLVIGGESAVSTTVDSSPYADLVRDVLACLDVSGHALVQVIASPAGAVVVECNARLGGASTLSLAAGLRSLAWFALEARGEDPAVLPFEPHDGPLRLVRTAQDVIDAPRL